LITGHADCMAFYFFDPVQKAIGLCHAGWRGALGRIGGNVIAQMRQVYGSDPRDMLCGVGPSICPKCFEVGEDVCEDFETAFPICPLRGVNERGNPTVDLWQVAACQFMEQGAIPEHIFLMGVCTRETSNLYSYRREGRTGGMAAFLRLTM
jgi:YfiH family protein